MSRVNLQQKDEIRLIDEDFKNDRWREAATDIQRFFDDGVRSFKAMGERGKWSRTHYQNVFHEHFEALPKDENVDDPSLDRISELIKEAYREGFNDGFEAARERE